MNSTLKRPLVGLALLSVLIHAVFCVQAYSALPGGGMVSSPFWLFAFFPHYILDFFLPPVYPLEFVGGAWHVDYTAFWGKMLVAFPASFVYAFVLYAVGGTLIPFIRRLTTRSSERLMAVGVFFVFYAHLAMSRR